MKSIVILAALVAALAIAILPTETEAILGPQDANALLGLMETMPLLYRRNTGNYYWDPKIPEQACNRYKGVTCKNTMDPSLQVVVKLEFIRDDLGGYLPDSIGDFRNLTELMLYHTKISGTIPSTINKLQNLESIRIEGSPVLGQLPDLFGASLPNLYYLSITDTHVSGTLPASWASLPEVGVLDLEQNRLTGPIPASWNSFPSLNYLDLSQNSLTGSVPGFTGTPTLNILNLQQNQLSGSLPAMIAPALAHVDLSSNNFQGSIPPQWNMQQQIDNNGKPYHSVLNLNSAGLSGTIPDIFGSTRYWKTIDLSHNNLTGMIPDSLTSDRLVISSDFLLDHNNLSLCPSLKRFDVFFEYVAAKCNVNHQKVLPKCSCIDVFLPTSNCWYTECY